LTGVGEVKAAGMSARGARALLEVVDLGLDGARPLAAKGVDDVAFVPNTARGPVFRGEGGRFGDLDARRVIGDDLTPHHIPQKGRGFTTPEDGGAIVMTTAEHKLTRTYAGRGARTVVGDANLSFRETLFVDIRDSRRIGGTDYNKGLLDVLDYYRRNFPELMKKGQ
jgi:hypothetical protein